MRPPGRRSGGRGRLLNGRCGLGRRVRYCWGARPGRGARRRGGLGLDAGGGFAGALPGSGPGPAPPGGPRTMPAGRRAGSAQGPRPPAGRGESSRVDLLLLMPGEGRTRGPDQGEASRPNTQGAVTRVGPTARRSPIHALCLFQRKVERASGVRPRAAAQSRPRRDAGPPTQPLMSSTNASPTTNHSKPVTSFAPAPHMPA